MEQRYLNLTLRRLEILRLYARGLTYEQVGDELGISRNTVATQMKLMTGTLNLPMHSIICALAKAGLI